MLILQRYIAGQVTQVFIISYLVLAIVLLAQLLSKLLGRVIEGDLTLDAVWLVLVLGFIKSASLLAPFGIMLSLLLVLAKLQQSSELSVMRSSGMASRQLFLAITYVVLPVSFLLMVAVSYTIPWANRFAEIIEVVSEQTLGLQNVVPGQFMEIKDQHAVIYIHAFDPGLNELRDVFLHRQSDAGFDVEVAHSATIQTSPQEGTSFRLRDGRHYQGVPGGVNFSITQYAEHALLLPAANFSSKADRPEYQPLPNLWKSSRLDYFAELLKRISIVVSVFVLALVAVALGAGQRRMGRNVKVVLGLTAFLLYFNVIVVTTKRIEDGSTVALVLQLSLPVLLVIASVWFYRRSTAVGG